MGLVGAGFLGVSAAAQARPTIYVMPTNGVLATPGVGAVGLYVPGTGGTVSRARAIAALRRGTVESDFGTPGGKILVDLSSVVPVQPLRPAVYVSLPPPGEHPNTKRYNVVIVGAGYHGILTSDSTQIRGLVSHRRPRADGRRAARGSVAADPVRARSGRTRGSPSAGHSAHARAPRPRVGGRHRRADAHRAGRLRASRGGDRRGCGHDRVLAPVLGRRDALRPGDPGDGGADDRTRSSRARCADGSSRIVVAAFLAAFTIVLAVDPELNSLAVLGARPDGGGRFYGVGNQVETLLLPPVLVAVAIGGRALARSR